MFSFERGNNDTQYYIVTIVEYTCHAVPIGKECRESSHFDSSLTSDQSKVNVSFTKSEKRSDPHSPAQPSAPTARQAAQSMMVSEVSVGVSAEF